MSEKSRHSLSKIKKSDKSLNNSKHPSTVELKEPPVLQFGKFIFSDGTRYEGNYQQIEITNSNVNQLISNFNLNDENLNKISIEQKELVQQPKVEQATQNLQEKLTQPANNSNVKDNAGNLPKTGKSNTGNAPNTESSNAVTENLNDDEILNVESKTTIVRHGFGKNICGRTMVIYEGEWNMDKMDGKGILTFPNGVEYNGNFKENKFQGNGEYRFSTGSKYQGTFDSGLPHGNGCYIDDHKWIGTFFKGKAVGIVELTN
ncbi:hypothetical protein HK099_006238 [Clydaea vesicula]|uniref:MORN repeat protein n=1 Tax=Clydaea vesicula TaxID=447962 RepID=A0AAD5TYH9_9FUNG|nr:hypothetical protein HK099_006238 [Clydaea vesicula]